MPSRIIFTSAVLLSFAACQQLPQDIQQRVDTMSDCDKVLALTQGVQDGFEQLKGAKVSSSLMSAWRPKAHLIENSCQINQYSNGRIAYECTKSLSSEAKTNKEFQSVKNQLNRCLGSSWQSNETTTNKIRYTSLNYTGSINLNQGKGLDRQLPWVITLEITK
ncbi:hypothetical protein CWB99_00705 [Pseudoalteromonas rubra]|uniref:Orphan lipoprotein n=1 Tax=Pseudoalteromonas rubra TaxID=43658 RepID=A0A5S3WU97_9GAMM|nr:hypothetical protein [Pseudoalteromonas rubra]TMP31715.1 hypothetical protein CWC00_13930 [Pseudoalteromonas rubra]TMP33203.1 hypothetical protein CWB99_00705 [Pseudoalteromonas rubra]